jgi:hypothetical protein
MRPPSKRRIEMRNRTAYPLLVLAPALLCLTACAEKSGSVPEVPAAELAADVPALDAVHEFMEPLWHEAFPAKDYEAIAAAVPRFEASLSALDQAKLPGILQDKQDEWDLQKGLLTESYEGLKAATESGNQEEMLAFTEAFHMNYEGMVRIIRPVVPELEVFHRQLYAVYHYYGPGYDLEKIRVAAVAMEEAIPPLQAARLPSNLEGRQAEFDAAVTQLGKAVDTLMLTLERPNRDDVQGAIDGLHVAYEEVELIFNPGSDD